MHLQMAVRVQQHAVLCSVCPSVNTPDDMVVMPSRQRRHQLAADRTDAALLFPKVQQLPSFLEVVCHFDAEARLKVDFPLRIEWIGRRFDLRMALDRHLGCVKQSDLVRLPVFVHPFAAKDPFTPADLVKVGVFNPSSGLFGVPAFCPLPERQEDRVIYFGKGLLARYVSVKVGPAPNNWVELSNQITRSSLRVGLYDSSNFAQERLHILTGRLYQDCAVIVTDVLSEELKSVCDMRDFGLLLREREPPVA